LQESQNVADVIKSRFRKFTQFGGEILNRNLLRNDLGGHDSASYNPQYKLSANAGHGSHLVGIRIWL
jgi:hypothetical protein